MRRSKHVLLCWEFGSGGRHVRRLKAISEQLSKRGFTASYALRRPEAGMAIGIPAEVIKSAPVGTEIAGATYGDGLAQMMLGAHDDLSERLRKWRALVEAERPDVIIADRAPSLSLLFHGQTPVVAIGNGYELPPPSLTSFPRLIEDLPLRFEEEDAVQRINDVLGKYGAIPIERLPQVNRADRHHLLTLPCLDPYRAQRGGGWLGSPDIRDIVLRMRPSQKLFAYFDEQRQTDMRIIEGLVRARLSGTAIFSSPLRRTVRQLESNGIRAPDGLAYLPFELLSCGVLVHQGGFGMAMAGIAAGVPQVIIEGDLESRLIAKEIASRNAGTVLDNRTFDGPDLAIAIRTTADDQKMQKAARDLSLDNTRYLQHDPIAEIARSIANMLDYRGC